MKLAGWVVAGTVGLAGFLGQIGCGRRGSGTQSQGCTGASCGGGSTAPCTSARTAPWPAGRAATYHSPIADENARPGDRLAFGKSADASGVIQLEAYSSRASARAGDRVDVAVSSTVQGQASWALYRIGWYGGAGAHGLSPLRPVPGELDEARRQVEPGHVRAKGGEQERVVPVSAANVQYALAPQVTEEVEPELLIPAPPLGTHIAIDHRWVERNIAQEFLGQLVKERRLRSPPIHSRRSPA